MKLSTTTIKFFICIVILIISFGIVLFCQFLSPETGIVIDKNVSMYNKNLEFKVLIKSEKYIIPLWVEVTENYYNQLNINDIYNKNENSIMYSYWLGK